MKIGVPKETAEGERRVALVPDVVKSLKTNEHVDVVVERGAGEAAGHPDSQYEEAGAEVVDPDVAWGADVVLRVAAPTAEEIGRLSSNQVLIGHLSPWTAAETNKALAAAGVTSFAMEAIPRTTRAQAMDALSSQAAAGGYAAMLIAARESGRFFGDDDHRRRHRAAGQGAGARRRRRRPAGGRHREAARRDRHRLRHPPRRLGADRLARRPPARTRLHPRRRGRGRLRAAADRRGERQGREAIGENAAKQDVIVTTAAIPGRPAPLLITADAVRGMQPGSVIVDLAAETGGNCELTEAGQTVVEGGVKVIGPRNLASEMPAPASQLYAKNLENLLGLLIDEEGELNVDFEDDIVAAACITHGGEIRNERAAK